MSGLLVRLHGSVLAASFCCFRTPPGTLQLDPLVGFACSYYAYKLPSISSYWKHVAVDFNTIWLTPSFCHPHPIVLMASPPGRNSPKTRAEDSRSRIVFTMNVAERGLTHLVISVSYECQRCHPDRSRCVSITIALAYMTCNFILVTNPRDYAHRPSYNHTVPFSVVYVYTVPVCLCAIAHDRDPGIFDPIS
jgi:hypothetical protein